MYAEIAFPISSYQTFTYKVPESLDSHIQVGIRVRAPFGNRMVQGLVVATHKATDFKGTLKEINDIVDDQRILDHNLWKLIQWMSKYYMTPIGQVARTILPSKLSTKYQPQKQWMVQQSTMAPDWSLIKNAPVQTLLLKAILQKKEICPVSEFGLLTSSPLTVCRALSDKGLVLLSEQILIPDATGFTFKPLDKTLNFSASQKEVLHDIEAGMVSNKYSPFVLHGVTGSGKTEIYIAAVQHALDNGKTAIVLLPEISLTPQIGGRFRSAFGDSVGLWHSKMSPALRAWTWKRMCSGDFKVIVGARSAIFAPLKNLGLIVVDEEQESSYKQESPAPRYHARDVALVRGRLTNATVVLASATPSLESYYNQAQNKLTYIHLPDRYGGAVYPQVHVVDMKQEQEESGKYGQVFSGLLLEKIEDRLAKKEQSIILQNRRGYAPVMHCFSCGEIVMCPNCQIALTYHKTHRGLQCHFCGYYAPSMPQECPSCRSDQMKLSGMGTQRVEELLEITFPTARILRLDQDTATSVAKLTKTLEKFADGDADILLGTQMIAKGLDFDRVTLAGIINADTGLFLPDFRSGERIFQLVYQTAGRTGRREIPGEVIVQTYNPENPVIKHAAQLHVKNYYNIALSDRQELNYPPFSWMVKLEFSGVNKEKVEQSAEKLRSSIKIRKKGLEILGPAFCYREKLRGRYRMQIVFKSSKQTDPNGSYLRNMLMKDVMPKLSSLKRSGVSIHFDIDPVSLM